MDDLLNHEIIQPFQTNSFIFNRVGYVLYLK